MTNQLTIPVPHKGWLPLALIILLTIAIFVVSIISLVSGWQTIFQNLFYLPIILACVYYVKRGFVFSVLLACGYFILMVIFSQDFIVLEGALIRVLIFILVAGVITYLSIIRIRAEDALKESEEFNRGLVENIPNLVVVYDHDRKIRYVNPAATTTLGYSVEEMEGTDVMAYVNPRQQTEIAAAIEERFSSDRGKSLEIDLITKAGQHLTVISKGAPLHFQNKPAVLILFADITDRKRAQEALRESEERYRSLYADSRDAVMIVSPDRGFLAANPATIRLFACQNEQDFKTHTPASLSPEYQPDGARSEDKAQEMMHLALEKGSHFFEWTHRRVDGTDFPATVLLSRLESGGTQILQATVRDITEQKKIEQEIARIARDWEVTFNATSDGICLLDAHQNLIRCNTRMGEILGGMEQEDLVNKPCWVVVHKTTEPIPECPFVSAKKTLKRTRIEIPAGDLWFEVTADPILDSSGTFTGAVHIMRDITERKRAEDALRQVNKQLNLLSSITRHDILNQLMALKGYLYLSKEMIDNPTILTGYIQKEDQAADAIENQIKFTRDYQELGVAAPEWQNVNASIEKALTGLPMRAVRIEIDPDNPEIFADRLFEKVFYNLIDNALRYGGADMKTIRVSSGESDRGLTILCEDDGVGISAGDKKKLFTRGFGKNTGLGLFLSREILAITGITITENGEPGKGARFEITVPKGMYRFTVIESQSEKQGGSS